MMQNFIQKRHVEALSIALSQNLSTKKGQGGHPFLRKTQNENGDRGDTPFCTQPKMKIEMGQGGQGKQGFLHTSQNEKRDFGCLKVTVPSVRDRGDRAITGIRYLEINTVISLREPYIEKHPVPPVPFQNLQKHRKAVDRARMPHLPEEQKP